MPPIWVVRVAVALVWLYEGLWCKLLGGDPNQRAVISAVPYWSPRTGTRLLMALGVVECSLGAWVLLGAQPLPCAIAQTALLVTLNANGIAWSRHLIHDPAGMVVKNLAFLVLAWVAAGMR
ncbi:MAG TPA: DoxX-like family protein [Kofleriaceae bacterium]|nr:DoxX-like family protein [Kofleriaceae bacterium]